MEKVGLIAPVFTERVKEICENVEALSNGQYRIGYCYSLEALNSDATHPDFAWAKNRGADLPDRLQEVLRNCDLLLPVHTSEDTSTLPLMTAKGTFILTDDSPATDTINKFKATAEEYGTKMNYGSLSDSNIAEKIVRFYRGE